MGGGALWIENTIELCSLWHNLISGRNMYGVVSPLHADTALSFAFFGSSFMVRIACLMTYWFLK